MPVTMSMYGNIPLVATGSIKIRDPEGLRSRASSSNKSVEWEREEGGIKPERTVSKEEPR